MSWTSKPPTAITCMRPKMNDEPQSLILLRRLISEELTPAGFSHADHIAVAFEALKRYHFFDALQNVANGLQALATRANAPTKFNATVTFACMSLIAERMQLNEYICAEDFLQRNSDLLKPGFLSPYYRHDRLSGALARSVALLPLPTTNHTEG